MATRLAAANRIADNGRMPVAYPPDADGYLPLKTSVVGRGILGAISYTRATPATVTDHEGVIRYTYANEVRFQGARRIYNLFYYSHEYNNVYWQAVRTTVTLNSAIGVDGKKTAAKIAGTAAGGSYFYRPINYTVGSTYVISARIKPINVATPISISLFGNSGCVFDLTGAGTAFAPTGSTEMSDSRITALANGYYRISVKFTPTTTAVINTGLPTTSYIGDICYIDGVQLEDVTGQSNQGPGEYVSTNVLTGFPYHGSGVDGVKCFDTTLTGAKIPESTLKGYFSEGARTNICPYSNIDATGWSIVGASRTSSAGTSPDGTNSFVKVIPSAGTQQSYIQNSTVTVTAAVHTISCYVKASGFNFIQLRTTSGLSIGYANYNISNATVGTFSTWTNTGIDTTSLPGVYRIWAVTDTLTAGTGSVIAQVISSSTDAKGATVTGDGVNGVLIWGFQVENGQNSSSYIPTGGTTATRADESLTYESRNVISNQGACSAIFTVTDSAQFDRRAIGLSGNTPNRLQFQVKRAGIAYANVFYGDGAGVQSVTSTQEAGTNNVAFAWTNGVDVSLYMNNTKYTSGVVPNVALTTVEIGRAGGLSMFGCVKNFRLWKTRPTDAELLFLSNNP